jgi:hypothetical protein
LEPLRNRGLVGCWCGLLGRISRWTSESPLDCILRIRGIIVSSRKRAGPAFAADPGVSTGIWDGSRRRGVTSNPRRGTDRHAMRLSGRFGAQPYTRGPAVHDRIRAESSECPEATMSPWGIILHFPSMMCEVTRHGKTGKGNHRLPDVWQQPGKGLLVGMNP